MTFSLRRILWIALALALLAAGLEGWWQHRASAREEQIRLMQIREDACQLKAAKEGRDPTPPRAQDTTPVDDATRASLARMFEAQRQEKAKKGKETNAHR